MKEKSGEENLPEESAKSSVLLGKAIAKGGTPMGE